ncbi:MAG: Fic family protein [bacterium]
MLTKLLSPDYLEQYLENLKKQKVDLKNSFIKLEISPKWPNKDYFNQVSAVYSSKIEGNTLDLDSFLNSGKKTSKTKEYVEILDLIETYEFAQKNQLNQKNFLKTHQLLSQNILIKAKQGKYRDEPVGVFSSQGLVYMALEAEKVEEQMSLLFQEIELLLKQDLNIQEVFYCASFSHLKLAQIHPFVDGNGRAARLLEKWFLATKLGQKSWYINSEEYYWNHRQEYYKNLNLGVNYYELDYSKSVPFLFMLVESLGDEDI